jgi:hypothetical protein
VRSRLCSRRVHAVGRCGSGSYIVLAGTAARPLAGHHDSSDEQLAAPDTPRLTPGESTVKALTLDGAALAEGLRELDVVRGLREEQLWVEGTARQIEVHCHLYDGLEDADTHFHSPPSSLVERACWPRALLLVKAVVFLCPKKRAAVPVSGSAAWR